MLPARNIVIWTFLHLFAVVCFSPGGTAQSSEPAFRDNFYGVAIAHQNAWIVGYYGTILHSRDGAFTWTLQNSKTPEALFRIASPVKDIAWVSGSYGTILHTRDGGQSWQKQASNTEEQLLGLHFLDARLGWIVGSRGVILRTEDGGTTWISTSVGEDIILNDVRFINPKEGWAVGEFGRIYQSKDGGRSWEKQQSPIEVSLISGESRNLFRLLFDDTDHGWAFGLDGTILRMNGRERWDVVRPRGAAQIKRRHLFAAASFDGRKFATGERGTVLVSQANGNGWADARMKIPPLTLNGIAFAHQGLGLIVGNRGLILRSRNGGTSWKQVSITAEAQAK